LTSTVAKVGAAVATSFAVTATSFNTLLGTTTGYHTNQIAITGTPVLTSNELYDAYLAYLGVPERLLMTATPPPPGAAHVCKRYDKCYYWVPVQFKKDYYDLATLVTAQRDRMLLSPADEYYVVTLNGSKKIVLIDTPTKKLKKDDQTGSEGINKDTFVVEIDKEVPNPLAGGILIFSDKTTTPFVQYKETPSSKTVKLKTQKLQVIYQKYIDLFSAKPLDEAGVKVFNGNMVPAFLEAAFKKHEILLGENPKVATVVAGKEWTITVDKRVFTAKAVEDKDKTLAIYEERPPLGAKDRDDLVAKLKKTPYQTVTMKYNDEGIRPSAPTTSELLNRIEFRHPQIQLKDAADDKKPGAPTAPNASDAVQFGLPRVLDDGKN
jgi:hypothetical protein